MLWVVRLVQRLVKALNSEGTPGQVAAGLALGAALGITPLTSLHNLVVLAAILLLNVSVPGALLGWMVFTPVAFLMDPLFDRVGRTLLLDGGALEGLWAIAYSTPVLALANLTNTIVLGSLVGWVVLAFPIFFGARAGIDRYREKVYVRYKDARVFRALRASKLYNLYRLFRP